MTARTGKTRPKAPQAPAPVAVRRRGYREGAEAIPEVTDKELSWFFKTFEAEMAVVGEAIEKDLADIRVGKLGRRPTTMDTKQIARICCQLRHFIPVDTACYIEGLAPETFYNWMRKGKDQPEQYPQCEAMRRCVLKSMALAEGIAVTKLGADACPNAPVLQWFLRTRVPKKWGPAAGADATPGEMPVAQIPGVVRMMETLAQGIGALQKAHPEAAAGMMDLLGKAMQVAAKGEPGAGEPGDAP